VKVGFPVTLSGQIGLEKQLDSIAHNVANAQTVGFRGEGLKFSSVISTVGSRSVSYASSGETFISRNAGEIVKTGNVLDVAVRGDGWFAIQTPNGTAYTRDGRFRIIPDGSLQTLTGHLVLDVGRAPIQLDPKAGPPKISSDGMITQNKKQVSAIGLFKIPPNANLVRYDTSSVTTGDAVVGIVDFSSAGVLQGFVEQSNVNAIMEMSHLIQVSRAFDMLNTLTNESEKAALEAIKTLGARV